jgi:hypothetical protein
MNRASPDTAPKRTINPAYLLAVYAATLPSLFFAGLAAPSSDWIAILKLACVGAFCWHAFCVWRHKSAAGSLLALAGATGLLWGALAVLYLYKVVAMAPLDFSMVLASMDDARRTLIHVLGPHGVPITVGSVAAVGALGCVAAWAALRLLRERRLQLPRGRRSGAACAGLLFYLLASDLWYAAEELVLYPREYSVQSAYVPALLRVPDYSEIRVRASDTVFVLQLESVNSLAVFEPVDDGARFQPRVSQPGLETIVKEGGAVLFPLFWANGTQTHRAWESIMCGISGNLGPPMTNDPTRLLRATCLPEHLAREGYASVFLYSYFDLEFFNLSGFARKAGFRDIVYGPRLMREGDRRHQWAYDDCAFYDRAFDYLVREGLAKRERLFAYFEVGMHHAPFFNSRKHPEAHPYAAPSSFLEHYLNSNAEQDHCLKVFWKRFRELERDDVHIFILPDHSVWVHGVPAYPDAGFATWLAYVPPKRRAAEFKPRTVVAPTPSQAQLYPTILELLEGTPLPGSFAFALRGAPAPAHYQDCHVLAEAPLRLVVRKNGGRTEHRLRASSFATLVGVPEVDFWAVRESLSCS